MKENKPVKNWTPIMIDANIKEKLKEIVKNNNLSSIGKAIELLIKNWENNDNQEVLK